MTEWRIEFHQDFFKDLDKLGKAELKLFQKKRKKIRANPERQKHLAGGEHYYTIYVKYAPLDRRRQRYIVRIRNGHGVAG